MTIAALKRGDKVIATARKRSLSQLEDLKSRGAETLELDVTAPIEELKAIATKAVGIYGKIDVIVNNAGELYTGYPSTPLLTERKIQDTYLSVQSRKIREIIIISVVEIVQLILSSPRPEETLNQFNTNVFGALNVTRAFLPYMRERKTGTVVFIGSIGGWRSVLNAGLYATTKFAFHGA